MGTRHLIAVYTNGEYKVAQYGQWDGYPEGQGKETLDFLKNTELFNKLKNNLSKCRFIKDENESNKLNALLKESDEKTLKWYDRFCTRDLGAKILTNIANSTAEEIVLSDHISFAKDGLFCEWAYVIDLDKNTLEVFEGFGKTKLGPDERFYDAEFKSDNGYEPIRLRAAFSLDSLPEESDFYSQLRGEEEEEVEAN